MENLLKKATKIKEESKLLSVVMDRLKYDQTNVNAPAFRDLTQAFAQQQLPSIQRLRTGGNTLMQV